MNFSNSKFVKSAIFEKASEEHHEMVKIQRLSVQKCKAPCEVTL